MVPYGYGINHAQLGLPDNGRAITGLVVCNDWNQEPLELLHSLALGCYQGNTKFYKDIPFTNIPLKIKV